MPQIKNRSCILREGILYSQVGYDIGDAMKAYYRVDGNFGYKAIDFEVADEKGKILSSGDGICFGEKWGSQWWIYDFSTISSPCQITITAKSKNKIIDKSLPIDVGYNIIWDKAIKIVAIDAFEERSKRARNGNGWKDCGSDFREVCSITPPILALCDLILQTSEEFSISDQVRIREQIVVGCDYLSSCMDIARLIGKKDGAIVHDIPRFTMTIPSDMGMSVTALARASMQLYELYPDKASVYLKNAIAGYEYILHELTPYGDEQVNRPLLGMKDSDPLPNEYMTRDLLLFMSAGIALYKAGQTQYKDSIINFANMVMSRQVQKANAQEGIYGHFYTFDSLKVTEKSFIHHDVGHDTGGVFPHYIEPFFDMCFMWSNDEDIQKWKSTITSFAENFFIPTCKQNPFNLLPMGYYEGQGWLNFCGPWHGFNATMGFTARLAVDLQKYCTDPYLKEIAVSNLQWFCGINAGFTSDIFDGAFFWEKDIAPNRVECLSQIMGVGNKSAFCWTDIVGSIPSGFSVNPQFKFTEKNTIENDAPKRFSDEDWVPHSAGLIFALTIFNI